MDQNHAGMNGTVIHLGRHAGRYEERAAQEVALLKSKKTKA